MTILHRYTHNRDTHNRDKIGIKEVREEEGGKWEKGNENMVSVG